MTTVVAEISANHLGSLAVAIDLLRAAADSGADAVKFQVYDPDKLCLDQDYMLKEGPWKGQRLVDLYHQARTPYCWLPTLFEKARKMGLTPFASVFDDDGLTLLEALKCPMYKISSFELVDIPLIEMVAKTGKALVMSTGMASFGEIRDAVFAARRNGCGPLTLLHCVSAYPAEPSDLRLGNLEHMRRSWSCNVGLSDHSLTNDLAVTAVSLGATMVEKHLTLNREDGGPDAGFSLEPHEFAELAHLVREAAPDATPALARPAPGYGPQESEIHSLNLRRSLYFTSPLPAGTIVAAHHIRSARPALGLPPSKLPDLIGRTLAVPVKRRGTPVSWEDFRGASHLCRQGS